MMIDDEELRNLYQMSSEEHLQKLEAGILHLEKHPEDESPLEELLREAHSMKGDSRMLGVKDVESLIHQVEHILGMIKRKEVQMTSSLSDRLYQGLDVIKKIVHEAVTGEAINVDIFHTLADLMQAVTSPKPPIPSENLKEEMASSSSDQVTPLETKIEENIVGSNPDQGEENNPPEKFVAISDINSPENNLKNVTLPKKDHPSENNSDRLEIDALPMNIPIEAEKITEQLQNTVTTSEQSHPETPPLNSSGYHIDTIRVSTRLLDSLMTQTGELTVTKIRIAHTSLELEELASLWEEWKNIRSTNNQLQDHPLENRLEQVISRLKLTTQENSTRLEIIAGELEDKIRTLRLLPLNTVFQLFPRMVRDLAKQQDKQVELIIEGGDTTADKQILEEIKDPLIHLIRNSIDHGIESPQERQRWGKSPVGTIHLKGYQKGNNIFIEVKDNGQGLNIEKIKQNAIQKGLYRPEELAIMTSQQIYSIIFLPGFSTRNFITEVSGRGVGLDVVHTNVERLKGSIQIESELHQGCMFRIQLGTTLATANVLLIGLQGTTYAIPIEYVETNLLIDPQSIFTIEGKEAIALENQAISIAYLSDLLELPTVIKDSLIRQNTSLPCVLLNINGDRMGVIIDQLLDTQDVVLKPQSKLLKRVRNITGATILGTGEVCMILNPSDLLKSLQKRSFKTLTAINNNFVTEQKKPLILLAEDSIATRTQEKRILESAGYEVVTAVDGLDGLNKLHTRPFSAVISDVQMPNLDGLSLTSKIRQLPEYNELPIILVTSLASDADKRRGAEAGANAYITKDSFNQSILLETLKRLI